MLCNIGELLLLRRQNLTPGVRGEVCPSVLEPTICVTERWKTGGLSSVVS